MFRTLTLLSGLLVLYGSLFPFEFSATTPAAVRQLLTGWWPRGPGDVLGNIALFVPWAAACRAHLDQQPHAALAVMWRGAALALAAQVGQLFVPQRDPALGDVVWNVVGCLAGLPLGRVLAALPAATASDRSRRIATGLMAAALIAEALPLVPSIDFALLKAHLHQLLDSARQPWPAWLQHGAAHFGLALVIGYGLAACTGTRWITLKVAGTVALAAIGQVFLVGTELQAATWGGLAAGSLAALALLRSRTRIEGRFAAGLAIAYVLGALAPFELRSMPADMSWLPFRGLLEGAMLTNAQSLLTDTVLFAALLHFATSTGASLGGTTLVLAGSVLALEGLQLLIVGRSGSTTPALLAALAGALLAIRPHAAGDPTRLPTAVAQASARQDAATPWRRVPATVAVLASAMVIALALHRLLRIPGVPYNVRELFRGDGHPLALLAFALALLWLGAGASIVGRTLARSIRPGVLLPPLAFGCGLVSLALAWSGATTESIGDIAGSTNLVWFVINKDIWGSLGHSLFVALDAPDAISFVERCVRYAALYGPLPILLGTWIALQQRRRDRSLSWRWATGLALGAGLALWLCKAIAFDWSSTDNLNELIARDGEWGWGGGGYLYALLVLLCLNGWALAESAGRPLPLAAAAAATLAALPIGWWLLNEGLEQQIHKYDLVYSGVQFLLGPDRSHTLSTSVLLVRWCVLQLAAVGLLAWGLLLERHALARRGPRRRAALAAATAPGTAPGNAATPAASRAGRAA